MGNIIAGYLVFWMVIGFGVGIWEDLKPRRHLRFSRGALSLCTNSLSLMKDTSRSTFLAVILTITFISGCTPPVRHQPPFPIRKECEPCWRQLKDNKGWIWICDHTQRQECRR